MFNGERLDRETAAVLVGRVDDERLSCDLQVKVDYMIKGSILQEFIA